MIGGLFLMLSYFGCDQSQVQRYLTAKSVDEARQSLLMSAFVKIPLQAARPARPACSCSCSICSTAADALQPAATRPLSRRPRARSIVRSSRSSTPPSQRTACGTRGRRWRAEHGVQPRDAIARVPGAPIGARRRESARAPSTFVEADDRRSATYNDVNYVFPTFITTQLPPGLVGLMIAAIFAAAMSASGGELNALATATVIDFYRRHFATGGDRRALPDRVEARDRLLGLVRLRRRDVRRAARIAHRGRQPVRLVLLRIAARRVRAGDRNRRANGTGAFVGLDRGHGAVAFVAFHYPAIAFLWHNVVGVTVVTVVGMAVSLATPTPAKPEPARGPDV